MASAWRDADHLGVRRASGLSGRASRTHGRGVVHPGWRWRRSLTVTVAKEARDETRADGSVITYREGGVGGRTGSSGRGGAGERAAGMGGDHMQGGEGGQGGLRWRRRRGSHNLMT